MPPDVRRWLQEHHHGDVFILAGDGPLIRGDVLRTLHQAHREEHAAASMATAVLDDPTGYGRVIRDDGRATLSRLSNRSMHAGAAGNPRGFSQLLLRRRWMNCCLRCSKLKNENKKREYYLTDIYGILRNAGKKCSPCRR